MIETFIYEPIFNKVFKYTDARGNTWKYIYDYMEDLDAAVAHFAPKLGVTADGLNYQMILRGITDQNSDVNGDGVTPLRIIW